VFVDIAPGSFNLDPAQVQAAITPRTTAILPVHVYGYPCDYAALVAIAHKHQLKLLYDAAHAFGVRPREGNLLRQGDLSVLSFHATKVFHTFEGGAVVCPDAATKLQLDRFKNFGFANELTVDSVGMNAKMNELQAAVGCVQLPLYAPANTRRATIDRRYREALAGLEGIEIPAGPDVLAHNYGYFPILVTPQCPVKRDALLEGLRARGVMARRYFYPLISEFPMYRHLPSAQRERLPMAHAVANQIVCLPIYADLGQAEQDRAIKAMYQACGQQPPVEPTLLPSESFG
jgi:dTDP-4-amino-4,6-dideoxygalactose transaminase